MTKCAPLGRLFLLLLLAFSFAGCSPLMRGTVSDEKDPHFMEGKRRNGSRDWDGSIDSFERALQSKPANAAAHFELGLLYELQKSDFGAAIYHYQRHLKLRPDSSTAETASNRVVVCKTELAKSVSFVAVPRNMQLELERFEQTNSLLKQQISLLQEELSRRPRYVTNYVTNLVRLPQFDGRNIRRLTEPTIPVPQGEIEDASLAVYQSALETPDRESLQLKIQSRTRTGPKRPEPSPKSVSPSTGRQTHKVKPGDTMDVIARRYGVSVSALKAANPGTRNGARAGQQLVIPGR